MDGGAASGAHLRFRGVKRRGEIERARERRTIDGAAHGERQPHAAAGRQPQAKARLLLGEAFGSGCEADFGAPHTIIEATIPEYDPVGADVFRQVGAALCPTLTPDLEHVTEIGGEAVVKLERDLVSGEVLHLERLEASAFRQHFGAQQVDAVACELERAIDVEIRVGEIGGERVVVRGD